ncbi:MAG: hypothetical protein PHX61_07785 [Alphaproteobacteria bacterium]|nr:hypothetical protein [Alphaproteobacteria bacterium]
MRKNLPPMFIVAILLLMTTTAAGYTSSIYVYGEDFRGHQEVGNPSLVVRDFCPYGVENATGEKDAYFHVEIERINKTDQTPLVLIVTRTSGYKQEEVYREEINVSSDLPTRGYIGKESMDNNVVYSWKVEIVEEQEGGRRETISFREYEETVWMFNSSETSNIQIIGLKTEEKNSGFWPFSEEKTALYATIKNTGEYGFHGEVYAKFKLSPDQIKDVTYLGTLGPGESREIKIGEKEGDYNSIEWGCDSRSLI